MKHSPRRRSFILPSAVGTALVAVAAAFTHVIFEYACGPLWENPSQDHIELCDVYPSGISLLGIAAAALGAVWACAFRVRWALVAGLTVGLAVVLFPWVAYGDPAGNWDGLFV
jgi:hypothetical protein